MKQNDAKAKEKQVSDSYKEFAKQKLKNDIRNAIAVSLLIKS